ncbi:MAG TPA: tRNA-specific adenosine deaminase [Chloroflexi bacterium]|nr:tRNA-specific adenosine deaminase [Chloroflexota bacterium]HCU98808.1 tRNA-specific adenosine deaminase [Chloroflexota bacterium]|tara:strand:+ start:2642 stop:3097 length:456 start_codon:yes stop_codon:yes gene_type:complete
MNLDKKWMDEAIIEARKSRTTGGIPIGSVLVANEQIIGRGHNQRVQKNNPILHAEMVTFQNAGRLRKDIYSQSTMYTSLSPCTMCAGTIVLYKIPRVVVGENRTVQNLTLCEDWLIQQGVEVINMNLQECVDIMSDFINEHPDVWNEDVGC